MTMGNQRTGAAVAVILVLTTALTFLAFLWSDRADHLGAQLDAPFVGWRFKAHRLPIRGKAYYMCEFRLRNRTGRLLRNLNVLAYFRGDTIIENTLLHEDFRDFSLVKNPRMLTRGSNAVFLDRKRKTLRIRIAGFPRDGDGTVKIVVQGQTLCMGREPEIAEEHCWQKKLGQHDRAPSLTRSEALESTRTHILYGLLFLVGFTSGHLSWAFAERRRTALAARVASAEAALARLGAPPPAPPTANS